jgi:hypothetical protein
MPRPRSRTVRPDRCQHLVLHRHHLTSQLHATRLLHQYHSQARRMPRHRRRAENGECARASTTLSRGSTRAYTIHHSMLPSDTSTQEDAQTRSSAHVAETRVVRRLTRRVHAHGHGTLTQIVSRLPVDDDNESDGAQADEEPLAGSRVHTDAGLANVDTWRRSAVVSTSRRSLVEDDEGRRLACSCDASSLLSYAPLCSLFSLFSLSSYDATLSNETTSWRSFLFYFYFLLP